MVNKRDPVIEFIQEALSYNVDKLIIDGAATVENIQIIHRMVGQSKIKMMKIDLKYLCKLTEAIWFVIIW